MIKLRSDAVYPFVHICARVAENKLAEGGGEVLKEVEDEADISTVDVSVSSRPFNRRLYLLCHCVP